MIPSSFDEANFVIDKPDCMSRDDCDALNVCVGKLGNANVIISCWRPTKTELEEISRTGRVWLTVLGTSMPVVILAGLKPNITQG